MFSCSIIGLLHFLVVLHFLLYRSQVMMEFLQALVNIEGVRFQNRTPLANCGRALTAQVGKLMHLADGHPCRAQSHEKLDPGNISC